MGIGMARPDLPPPRPVLWPLRPRESARVSVAAGDGRVVVTIEHAPLHEVTAEMLAWWFRHVPGTMAYAGGTYSRYEVWHPLDHISYTLVRPDPHGAIGPGAELRITEALGRNLDNLIDIRVTVEEFGDGRSVVVKRVMGAALVRLENEFQTEPAGARYVSRMTIGDTTPLGRRILNRIAHRRAFPPKRIEPWIRHHIEEIGNLEHFLPDLVRERAELEP
jgi:DAPG hydrolase PhiG domain